MVALQTASPRRSAMSGEFSSYCRCDNVRAVVYWPHRQQRQWLLCDTRAPRRRRSFPSRRLPLALPFFPDNSDKAKLDEKKKMKDAQKAAAADAPARADGGGGGKKK